jgi:protein dithiol:quinone oxidoreductase
MSWIEALRSRRRAVSAGLALCCVAMFGYAMYSQESNGLQPCPLCIFQRIAVVGLGGALLLAALLPQRARVVGNLSTVLIGLVALAGMGVSARHLYIQAQPAGSVPACGASLDYMWDVFPLADVLKKVLTGSGECAKIDWTFLGLSMPGWVLICIAMLGTLGVLANWRIRRQ